MRVRGFAELVFSDSARLAFLTALERAQTDVDQRAPDAWVIDDRRIRFAFEGEVVLATLDAYRRLLEHLIEQAAGGEASLALGSGETWSRHVGDSASHALGGDEDRFPTLRTAG